MRKIYFILFMFALAIGFVAPLIAEAALVQVNSSTNLKPNDAIKWQSLGVFVPSPVNSPFHIASNEGNIATVTNLSDTLFGRLNEGNGWNGNFAPGAALLSSNIGGGPMVIEFEVAVAGVGAQIQAAAGGPFTAQLDLYDETDTLIGSFTVNGVSTNVADNSAPFLGVRETTLDPVIKRIEFFIVGGGDFAVGKVDLVAPAAIPSEADNKSAKFTFYYAPPTLVHVDSGSAVSYLLKEPGEAFELPCKKDVTVSITVPDPDDPFNSLTIFTQKVKANTVKACSKKYRYTNSGKGLKELVFEPVSTTRVYSYVLIDKTDFLPAIRAALTPAEYLEFVKRIDGYTITFDIGSYSVSGTASLIPGDRNESKQQLILDP